MVENSGDHTWPWIVWTPSRRELKKRNAGLEDDLRQARQRLADESDSNRRWARERTDIKSRIEKVLSDIEVLEGFEERKEVAFD